MNRRNFLMTVAAGMVLPIRMRASSTPLSDEEQEQFLLQAKIIKKKGTKVGTTGTSELTLRQRLRPVGG